MAQRGVDYWTTEDQPFITKDMLFRGLGSIGNGLFVPREADLQRFPRFVTDPRVNIPLSGNRASEKQKQKRLADAAKKAAKARAKLDLELETTQVGRMMRLQDADARRNAMQMPIDPRVGVPQGGFPGQLPPPPPSLQTELATSEMGRMMKLQEQDARYIAAATAALGPRGGTNVLGGNKTGIPANPIDPREHAAAQLANADDARLAARGVPAAGQAGIAALMGANTGIPATLTERAVLGGNRTGENVLPNPLLQPSTYAQTGLVPEGDTYNGFMPYMTDPRIGGPQGLGPEHFAGGPEDLFRNPEGGDPNSRSNRLYRYIAEREGEGPTGLGQDLTALGDKAQKALGHAIEKSGEKLESYITPRGPYGTGGTPMGEDLSYLGTKAQEFFDYLGTVPVPGVLRDPVGTISGALPDSKPEEPKLPADYDLSGLLDEEEVPEEGGGDSKGEPDALDVQMEKYLAATDTSYDDALATINKAYSGLEAKDNPRQAAADAYAAREGERTAALAQLALAGGLITSAGKSWEGLGQGVRDSAGVYSQGFDRYHRALIDSATRFDERQKGDRALELSKRGAALDMWSSGQTDRRAMIKELFTQQREERKDAATIARDEKKFTRENLAKRFESEAKVLFPTDGTSEAATPEARSEFYERWELSDKLRKYVSEDEYRARKARAAAKAAAVVDLDLSD